MNMNWEKEFIEAGAALEHARWARWQMHLHSKCIENPDGTLTIPAELLVRWNRQIATDYTDLPDYEKASDRREVNEYLPLIRTVAAQAREEGRKEIIEMINATPHHQNND